jgi:hypothetical protein
MQGNPGIRAFQVGLMLALLLPLHAGAWQITTVDGLLGDVGRYASMAVLPNGQPAISYFDATSQALRYAEYDGANWNVYTVATGVGTTDVYNSLAVVGGEPAITYYQYGATSGTRILKYAYRTGGPGGPWTIETVDANPLSGAYNSLAVDPGGNPAVSYLDRANFRLRYAIRLAGSWSATTVDPNSVQGFTSLAMVPDPNTGTPRPAISYSGAGKRLMFAWHDGVQWQRKVIDENAQYEDTCLAVVGGRPAIAFFDATNGHLRFARHYGANFNFGWFKWIVAPGSAANPVGRYPSLIELPVGAQTPLISYHRADPSGGLALAYWADPNDATPDWATMLVEGPRTLGLFTSLRRVSGRAAIAYYDQAAGNLKYAWLDQDCNGSGVPDELEGDLEPTIEVEPEDAEVCVGATAVFSVEAGTGPGTVLHYEWHEITDGDDIIVGEDQSWYETPPVTLADDGKVYRVRVFTDCGEVWSVDAVLSVFANPTPTISANPGETLCAGTTITLDAGEGYSEYQWSTGERSQSIEVTEPGTYSVTVWDVHGCTGSDEITITLEDEPPTIFCPGPATVETDEDVCFASVENLELNEPEVEDNCGVAGVVNDLQTLFPDGQIPVGEYTVTWTVTDTAGLTATCEQTLIVVDAQPPATACPNALTVEADQGACLATGIELSPPETWDNCEVDSVSNDFESLFPDGEVPVGEHTITWTVTDTAGLTATCEQTLIVVDAQPPAIACPPDVTVNVDAGDSRDNGFCYASNVDLGQPEVADNCDVQSVTNDAPEVFPLGQTVVTWIVTDTAGLTATCTQTVTVVDNVPPLVFCPPAVTFETDADVCFATGVELDLPETWDNCEVDSVTNDFESLFPDGEVPVGEHTITWTVTDTAGLTATCEQTLIVVDAQPPVISACPPDRQVIPVNNIALVPDMTGEVVAVDNCPGEPTVTQAPPAGTVIGVGQTLVTMTVTDASANRAQCTVTLTVTLGPTLCPGDMNCDGEITFADIDWFVEALAGPESWTHDPCPWLNADTNGDSDVTFADIDGFVAAIGTTCP